MPILIDTTVLSNLAVVDRLDLLKLLPDTCYLASAVYEEIQQGLAEGYEFLAGVDRILDTGLLLLVTIESEAELQQYRNVPNKLQRGEAMSLAIGRCRGWRLLTDDRAVRTQAERIGVPCSGTLGLLCLAARKGAIAIDEGNTLLGEMILRARYRSPVNDLRSLLGDELVT
jgi:predicted nucleic acid-binding protein